MKKLKAFPYIVGAVAALIVMALGMYIFCPAINIKSLGFWILINVALLAFVIAERLAKGCKDFGFSTTSKGKRQKSIRFNFSIKHYLVPLLFTVTIILINIIGSTFFNAVSYSEILKVKDSNFASDLAESVGTDSIALMDTASAQMLGDREIGTLSNVVSQFDVSYEYTQIDYKGKPIKVAPLEYAGFFKWSNNKSNGIKGYVSVDPVSMSASFNETEGMKYVPSAYFGEDAFRYLRLKYPTLILGNLHFEIDENGKPYYVASIIDHTIALFGGKTVIGCVVLDPVSGETAKYDLSDIPQWIDVVFDGDLICRQYNWYGMYRNGFFNSIFGKKDCKQVTTYTPTESEDEESSDETPFRTTVIFQKTATSGFTQVSPL